MTSRDNPKSNNQSSNPLEPLSDSDDSNSLSNSSSNSSEDSLIEDFIKDSSEMGIVNQSILQGITELTNNKWIVKLYKITEESSGEWEDMGTGYAFITNKENEMSSLNKGKLFIL